MEPSALLKLRFPIGPFALPDTETPEDRAEWLSSLGTFPARLRKETDGLTDEQLAWRYRPGGWNIRQLIHHCADSHMNALIRFKLALTESKPTIKPYDEAAWVELADAKMPVQISLNLLDALHAHWVRLVIAMSDEDFKRSIFHPEHQQSFSLHQLLAHYSWHGEHHLAHVQQAIEAAGRYGLKIK